MKLINIENHELKKLFSLRHADHGVLKQTSEDGFVVSKSRPGVAWIKAVFSSKVRTENRQVRQDFVNRLIHVRDNQPELENLKLTKAFMDKAIRRISANSWMPLSRKYLAKTNTKITLGMISGEEKGTVRTGFVIYKLFGKKAALKYLNYKMEVATQEQQGTKKPSILSSAAMSIQKKFNGKMEKHIEEMNKFANQSMPEDLEPIDEDI